MNTFLLGAALFLLINLAAGMVRVYLGPTTADRLLTLLLFGTTTVATLLLLAYSQASAVLVKVALLFVMLAAIASVAFVRFPHETVQKTDDGRGDHD